MNPILPTLWLLGATLLVLAAKAESGRMTMDDHTISWANLISVALGSGAVGYLLGAASMALVLGLLRTLKHNRTREETHAE